MRTNFIDFERVERLSLGNTDIQVSMEQKMIKLTEETGELAQAMLKMLGAKNVSASAGETKDHVLEEICDVLNVTLDMVNALGFNEAEAKAMFDKKLDKWESKVKMVQNGEI